MLGNLSYWQSWEFLNLYSPTHGKGCEQDWAPALVWAWTELPAHAGPARAPTAPPVAFLNLATALHSLFLPLPHTCGCPEQLSPFNPDPPVSVYLSAATESKPVGKSRGQQVQDFGSSGCMCMHVSVSLPQLLWASGCQIDPTPGILDENCKAY